MKIYTPSEAHSLATELLVYFPMMGQCVITGTALDGFNAATKAAKAACELPATAATCRLIEQQLGLMFNLFYDAPLLNEKPREQIQMVLDCIEIVGSACHAVGIGNYR